MNEELLEEFSNILKEKNIDISSIMNDTQKSSEDTTDTSSSTNNDSSNFDLNTILKLKKIIDKMNTNQSKNIGLLMAIKPFMRESRKEKIDKYAQLLKVAEIFKDLDILGGDNT